MRIFCLVAFLIAATVAPVTGANDDCGECPKGKCDYIKGKPVFAEFKPSTTKPLITTFNLPANLGNDVDLTLKSGTSEDSKDTSRSTLLVNVRGPPACYIIGLKSATAADKDEQYAAAELGKDWGPSHACNKVFLLNQKTATARAWKIRDGLCPSDLMPANSGYD